MSVRSSARLRTGQSDEAKEAASAPVSSTRGATRKRDADDEPQQASEAPTAAAAASASASSVPDSKRPRRSSRTRSSASAASAENKEDEEEEADGDEAKSPHAAEDDDDSAADDEGQQGASDESDADAAMADASDSLLDSLRVATVGHTFSAATVAGRPALPLLAVARVCDFLTAADIVLGIAPTARASYATAVEYAEMVAQSAAAASEAAAARAASKKQSSRKRGGGGRTAAAAVVAEPFSAASTAAGCSVGRRSEVSVFTSARALTLLCASRLRSIVAGIHTRSAKKKEQDEIALLLDEEVFPLDARLLGRISDAIPTLTSLQCQLTSSSRVVQPAFEFPVGLRDLNLSLMLFTARFGSVAKRRSRCTKQTWSEAQCDAFAEWCVAKAAALPRLTTLTLRTCRVPYAQWDHWSVADPKPSWIQPLVSTLSLRHFTCNLGHVSYTDEADWTRTLTQLVQLDTLIGGVVHDHLWAILRQPHRFKRLQRVPLGHAMLSPGSVELLRGFSRSLTDLCPARIWDVDDISFLHEFTQLRRLSLAQLPMSAKEEAVLTASHIVETIESLSAARRAQLEFISVSADIWTNEWVLRLLAALPGLAELELQSEVVTSLAAFSSVASLRSSLRRLHLRTPSVPRDSVSHLLSLSELTSLDIADSFSEPLYARQLWPFLPPYPKQPLHWLRSFVPRSAKEPVPSPPVDPAAKAAADAEFAARVRAGGVRAAELLNSAQLSCVMQFLDMADFSIAARTCRSWRVAACLPSAWSLGGPAVFNEDESASVPLDHGVSPPQWAGNVDYSFDGSGRLNLPRVKARDGRARILRLTPSQPYCCPSVLPGLPLWLNAKSVVIESCAGDPDEHSGGVPTCFLEADRQALLAIAPLPRLESLATTVDMQSETASSVLMQLGPRLQHLECRHFPPTVLSHLSALTELRISGGGLRGELSVLHRLRRLTLTQCWFGHELSIALRVLSRDHALHELNVAESGDLAVLLPVLAGESVEIPPNDEDDPPVAALTVPPSSPALLNRLRLLADPGETISCSTVLRLPGLRHFEFLSAFSAVVDLSPLETFVLDGQSLPPIEVLLLSTETHGRLDFVEQLTSLRELRLSDGQSESSYEPVAPVPEDFNPRWAQKLATLQRLEVIVLNGVQIDPMDVATLDQLPKLRALTLNRQQSLRVSDLAVLLRMCGLTELQLDNNPLLLLQKRDWMKDNGRQLPGESAIADAETGADAAAQSMQDVEEQKADTGAEQAPAAAAAAASSSVPALPADADGMLPLLLQCRSLRLLRWSCPAEHGVEAESYTSRHSWVRPSARVRGSSEFRQQCSNKEIARERQALRMLIAAIPGLTVEYGVHRPGLAYLATSIRTVVLPPQRGSIVETEVAATAERARKLDQYDIIVSSNPSLQAYEDRALLAIEREEELQWRADAERKAAAKPKRRSQY